MVCSENLQDAARTQNHLSTFHAKTYDTFRNTMTEGQHMKMKTLA